MNIKFRQFYYKQHYYKSFKCGFALCNQVEYLFFYLVISLNLIVETIFRGYKASIQIIKNLSKERLPTSLYINHLIENC